MDLIRGTYVKQSWQPDPSGFGPRAVRRATTYQAFVPAPIGDVDLSLSGSTSADIADAEGALVRLREQGQTASGLESLTRSLMRSEAVASSWIEALRISHRKLAEAEQASPGSRYDEARRVLGNVRAMAAAIEIGAASRPFTVEDILSMHGMLMSTSNVREDRDRAGRVRDEPVFIGGTTPLNADYVGPPPELLDDLMSDLVAFVNERLDLSPTVVAALAHAQFESIHPFHDGNGRVGRCLTTRSCEERLTPTCFLRSRSRSRGPGAVTSMVSLPSGATISTRGYRCSRRPSDSRATPLSDSASGWPRYARPGRHDS